MYACVAMSEHRCIITLCVYNVSQLFYCDFLVLQKMKDHVQSDSAQEVFQSLKRKVQYYGSNTRHALPKLVVAVGNTKSHVVKYDEYRMCVHILHCSSH